MVLIIVLAAVFGFMFLVKKGPGGVKRCWDAPVGEKKIHHWVLQSEPNSPAIILVCKVCGQKPGEE